MIFSFEVVEVWTSKFMLWTSNFIRSDSYHKKIDRTTSRTLSSRLLRYHGRYQKRNPISFPNWRLGSRTRESGLWSGHINLEPECRLTVAPQCERKGGLKSGSYVYNLSSKYTLKYVKCPWAANETISTRTPHLYRSCDGDHYLVLHDIKYSIIRLVAVKICLDRNRW